MKYSEYKCTGGETDGAGSGAATPTQLNPIQRKKKPKRRSTGVVNLEMEVSGKRVEFISLAGGGCITYYIIR